MKVKLKKRAATIRSILRNCEEILGEIWESFVGVSKNIEIF
jgi:hypothetical protein